MRNIIVTGGSGFLGSHIVDELSRKNYNITLVDIVEPKILPDNVKFVQCNLSEERIPQEVLSGCDVLYHLAGFADLNSALDSPFETVRDNVVATVQLLEDVKKNNIDRFIFASTIYVYSNKGGFYKASKQACEAYIEEYHKRYGINFTVLRYGSLYGLRTDERNGVYRLLKKAIYNDNIEFNGSADEKREYIHVEDAARLSVECMNDDFNNDYFLITGRQSISAKEIFMIFSEILDKKIDVLYNESGDTGNSGHYVSTPYTYMPKPGKKMVSNVSVDFGQGLLQLIEDIYLKDNNKTDK